MTVVLITSKAAFSEDSTGQNKASEDRLVVGIEHKLDYPANAAI